MSSQDYRNTSSKDARLYGIPRKPTPSNKPTKSISSSNTLSFTNALSSLISASVSTSTSASTSTAPNASSGRARPSRSDKSDIFTSHNRNSKKRAAADLAGASDAVATATSNNRNAADHALDDASWRRTKRKMEEKARLYAAMKRGDVDDDAEKHMVDFDRKWAEKQEKASDGGKSGESDDDDDDEEEEDFVEYTDEFGRSRRGTRGDAVREERRRRAGHELDSDRFTARPAQPSNLILGDTVQAAAFNPDEPIALQMEALAAKRDRELTPPPETHYDANWEVRNRGTGFFQFSKEEEGRRAEMESLERERGETERIRREREARKEEKKKEVEERRRLIREKRGKLQAERFLDNLGGELMEKELEKGGGDDGGEKLVDEEPKD